MRKRKRWCQLCREGGTDVACSGEECHKRFHSECLVNADQFPGYRIGDEVHCFQCGSEPDNEDFCYKCNKKSSYTMLLCDTCPKSFHIKCIGLKEIPEEDEWSCPVCAPTMTKQSRIMAGTGGNKEVGNMESCYVCQKEGTLIGCCSCQMAYHSSCLDPSFLQSLSDEWKCPLCIGVDPLRFMGHKRMNRAARVEVREKRQRAIRKWLADSRRNRNQFLCSQRNCIEPFVDSGTMAHILREGKKNVDQSPAIEIAIFRRLNEQSVAEEGHGLLNEGVFLRSYQEYGVAWLVHSFQTKAGAILSDEMGLGKTIQTIAFISAIREFGIKGPHLVVVPLSTVGNWVREFQRFASHLTFVKICGSRAEREHAILDPAVGDGCIDVYITTYETVATEESFFVDEFSWGVMVLDEAHRIKTEGGRVRHSLDRVSSIFRTLLTGTPLQNNVRELYVLLNFMFPTILTEVEEFEKAFQTGAGVKALTADKSYDGLDQDQRRAERKKRADRDLAEVVDDRRLSAVHKLLSALMLRRTKETVVNLPPKYEREIWLPLAPVQAKMYYAFAGLHDLDTTVLPSKKLMSTVIRLRLVAGHPKASISEPKMMQKILDGFWEAKGPEVYESTKLFFESVMNTSIEDSIMSSSKLVFLDKLLCQLHRENFFHISFYRDWYCKCGRDRCESFTKEKAESREHGVTAVTKETSWPGKGFVPEVPEPNWDAPEELSVDWELAEPEMQFEAEMSEHPLMKKQQHQTVESYVNSMKDNYKEPDPTDDNETQTSLGPKVPHKVLIFTQFTLILNILVDYCRWRGFAFFRLDGSTNKMVRELDIREFNQPDSPVFVYLISTRAGGVGINLAAANHVILFDEDWNPFMDRQAIDRAHRIGQSRGVQVWKLTTEWTVEERMAFRRSQKLALDKKIIEGKRKIEQEQDAMDREEGDKISKESVRQLLVYGIEAIRNLHRSYETTDSFSKITEMTIGEQVARRREPIEDSLHIVSESEDSTMEAFVDEEGIGGTPSEPVDSEGPPSGRTRLGSELESTDVQKRNAVTSLLEEEPYKRRRTLRVRKAPTLRYEAAIASVKKPRQPILHEQRCFCCGYKEFERKVVEGKAKTEICEDDPSLMLAKCRLCPKAYHAGHCLGQDVEDAVDNKLWRCPWHECSLCFRKSSAAGGLLIHCSTCPHAFCFDCFPPEYRRYTPEIAYFQNLTSRGFKVNESNFVTFLCSRCKAMEHQVAQAALDKEELRTRVAKQKAEQAALREMKKEESSRALIHKDELVRQKAEDKAVIEEARKVAEDEKKAARFAREEDRKSRAEAKELYEKEVCDMKKFRVELSSALEEGIRIILGDDATEAQRKDALKMVERMIGICPNCILPGHVEVDCPQPPSTRRFNHLAPLSHIIIDDEGVPRLPEDYPCKELFMGQDILIRRGGVFDFVSELVDGYETSPRVKLLLKKKNLRTFCSSCGVARRSNHLRRSCPRRSEEEKTRFKEVEAIREKVSETFRNVAEKQGYVPDAASSPTPSAEQRSRARVYALDVYAALADLDKTLSSSMLRSTSSHKYADPARQAYPMEEPAQQKPTEKKPAARKTSPKLREYAQNDGSASDGGIRINIGRPQRRAGIKKAADEYQSLVPVHVQPEVSSMEVEVDVGEQDVVSREENAAPELREENEAPESREENAAPASKEENTASESREVGPENEPSRTADTEDPSHHSAGIQRIDGSCTEDDSSSSVYIGD